MGTPHLQLILGEIEADAIDSESSSKTSAVLELFLDNTIELPTLPEVAWKVRDAMARQDISVNEISLIVQNDPAISARLIQVANSPLYRGLTKVENLRMVVGRLGLKSTQTLVMTIAVKQLFRAQTSVVKKRLKELYEHSSMIAALSSVVADKLPGLDPDRAALCGLLHDIGVIPILNRADKQPEYFETDRQLEETIAELSVQAGSWLLKKWNFDSEFIEVTEHSRNWHRDKIGVPDYCDVVICALLLKQSMVREPLELPAIHDLPLGAKLAENGLVIVSSQEFIEEASEQIEAVHAVLN
jgi:HD-like signal output (HDOD) protein